MEVSFISANYRVNSKVAIWKLQSVISKVLGFIGPCFESHGVRELDKCIIIIFKSHGETIEGIWVEGIECIIAFNDNPLSTCSAFWLHVFVIYFGSVIISFHIIDCEAFGRAHNITIVEWWVLSYVPVGGRNRDMAFVLWVEGYIQISFEGVDVVFSFVRNLIIAGCDFGLGGRNKYFPEVDSGNFL